MSLPATWQLACFTRDGVIGTATATGSTVTGTTAAGATGKSFHHGKDMRFWLIAGPHIVEWVGGREADPIIVRQIKRHDTNGEGFLLLINDDEAQASRPMSDNRIGSFLDIAGYRRRGV